MLKRLYVHNFRCLQNFELKPGDESSVLLIGKNGTGKSSVLKALDILRKLASGNFYASALVTKDDFTLWNAADNDKMTFSMEVGLDDNAPLYGFSITMDYMEKEEKMRVLEERFSIDGKTVYACEKGLVSDFHPTRNKDERVVLGWQTMALPVIADIDSPQREHIRRFRDWLTRILLLAPIPQMMGAESTKGDRAMLSPSCSNFASFLTMLLAENFGAYPLMKDFIQPLISGFEDMRNEDASTRTRILKILFTGKTPPFEVDFDKLSCGEKCLFLCASVLAALEYQKHLFVFWDEPDNYLALSEIQGFILSLRATFLNNKNRGQIWMTSHNAETIQCFPRESIYYLTRTNHCEPVAAHPLESLYDGKGSLIVKLLHDDLEA